MKFIDKTVQMVECFKDVIYRTPEWATAEHLDRIVPQSEIWKYR